MSPRRTSRPAHQDGPADRSVGHRARGVDVVDSADSAVNIALSQKLQRDGLDKTIYRLTADHNMRIRFAASYLRWPALRPPATA